MPAPESKIREIVQMRIARRFRWGLIKSRSKAELDFENILKELELDFIRQAIFLNSRTFFIVDFFIKFPHNVVVEVDGKNHIRKARNARDREQDEYFRSARYTAKAVPHAICGKLLRFQDEEILNEPEKVKARLVRELIHGGVIDNPGLV